MSGTSRQMPLRVDVAGVAIYVRSEFEYRHLEHINRKLAIARLALSRIAAQQVGASGVALKAIEDMKNA